MVMNECFLIALLGWITTVVCLAFLIKAIGQRDKLFIEVKALKYVQAKYYDKLEASDE
jgi:hypothetical protein